MIRTGRKQAEEDTYGIQLWRFGKSRLGYTSTGVILGTRRGRRRGERELSPTTVVGVCCFVRFVVGNTGLLVVRGFVSLRDPRMHHNIM